MRDKLSGSRDDARLLVRPALGRQELAVCILRVWRTCSDGSHRSNFAIKQASVGSAPASAAGEHSSASVPRGSS